jgi:hypothetical protein
LKALNSLRLLPTPHIRFIFSGSFDPKSAVS